jgi:hypothetical protein
MRYDLFCNRIPVKISVTYASLSARLLPLLAHFPFLRGRDGSSGPGPSFIHGRR